MGNIKCISNPDEIALGMFEVTRKVVRTYGFYWVPGSDNLVKMEIENYNPPRGSQCTDSVPDFDWITFN